ncbi:hypothetical protein [Paractinoplanes rishiriensis]|uniref:F5/8 type C domain-containing protein n=1 Tax=Paractinoplanes rishiriensis TaxID=1050105 RepID=A0A919K3P1_9ACTN|nr:hypothetical protein [Actinoplanes rishiriensis]GIE99613.1 hypothetical protein Ari01nite_70780 [Actinoplanes rishiriensis]
MYTGGIHRPYPGQPNATTTDVNEGSSVRSQWTLALAVMGSVLLIGATVLFWRHEDPSSNPPTVALPGPWEPPTAGPDASAPVLDVPPAPGSAGAASPRPEPTETADDEEAPPRTTSPTRPPTTRPTTRPPAPNLSLGANTDADGSTKADGTSFNDVRDGSLSTFWSPTASTGTVSVKWPGTIRLSRIIIKEPAGTPRIRAWRVKDHDANTILATGTGAGEITFTPTTLRKISFEILTSNGTPRVAEFETFAQ